MIIKKMRALNEKKPLYSRDASISEKIAAEIEDQYVYVIKPNSGKREIRNLQAYANPSVDNGYYFTTSSPKLMQKGIDVLNKYHKDFTQKGNSVYWTIEEDELDPIDTSMLSAKARKLFDEDIEKTKSGKWVNKGKEGTHGEFKTKKAARAQQKAMYARGFKEGFRRSVATIEKMISFAQNSTPATKNKLISEFNSWNEYKQDQQDFENLLYSNTSTSFWNLDTIVRDHILDTISTIYKDNNINESTWAEVTRAMGKSASQKLDKLVDIDRDLVDDLREDVYEKTDGIITAIFVDEYRMEGNILRQEAGEPIITDEEYKDAVKIMYDTINDYYNKYVLSGNKVNEGTDPVTKDDFIAESKGVIRKYKGYTLHDTGDSITITDPHGKTVGTSRSEIGAEGLIDSLVAREDIKENIGSDIAEYQKWVDYDMKKYGKISDDTNEKIRKAGLKIVKDKYGDYEVIANEPIHADQGLNEELSEDSKTSLGVATILDALIKDELEAIDGYNGAISTLESEGYSEFTEVLNNIINDEKNHIGNLQELLNKVSPDTHSEIQKGKEEAKAILDNKEEQPKEDEKKEEVK